MPRIPLRLPIFFLLFASLLVMPIPHAESGTPPDDRELGYRRIFMKDRVAAFYREGGRSYLDKRVHLLVPADRFRNAGRMIRRPKGVIWIRHVNRNIPLLLDPRNLYYKRLMKTLEREAKRKAKKMKGVKRLDQVAIYARVIRPDWDLKGRCHLFVEKIKTCGGALRKSAD